jgi:signal transduction histidine kinase
VKHDPSATSPTPPTVSSISRVVRGRLSGYAVAVVLGGFALALGSRLPTHVGLKVPFIAINSLFIVLSAWLGGVWPGLVCTALCVLGAAQWLEPAGSLRVQDPAEVVGLAIFTTVGVGLSVICEQLRRARKSAERAAELERHARRIRDDVMAVVAHDLANPLVAIDANAALLEREDRDGSDVLRRRATTLHRSVRRIRRMLLDLLDTATLETGDVSIAPSPQPPAGLLSEAADLYREEAEGCSVQIVLDAPGEAPAVMADHDRVLQVLSHLTGRALRLTPPGGQLRLSAKPQDHHVRFAVNDAGHEARPKEEDHRSGVSDRVFRAPGSAESGRGAVRLSLAKAIVEAHGGQVEGPTQDTPGGAFSFTLPLAGPYASASAPGDTGC